MRKRPMAAGLRRVSFRLLLVVGLFAGLARISAQYPPAAQITKNGISILLEDYASLPRSRPFAVEPNPLKDSEGLQHMQARVNLLISEPADAPQSSSRFFVIDQNGPLYLLDKATKSFAEYLDFGTVFGRFTNTGSYGGFSGGLVSMAFDPGYARNGKFYTVHAEQPMANAAAASSQVALSGLTPTLPINPPLGEVWFESVVTEWTDTNVGNARFEGTAREILRVGFSFVYHPMGDVLFNPLARPGDADYGNLYIGVGDGTVGERPGVTHGIPQRLDALQGKILRITPDIALRPKDRLGANGRYRIPSTGAAPNPFASMSGARAEIFAYGFRNPHRLTWDAVTDTFVANDIGRSSWEEVNIVSRGGNYGWADREGPEQVFNEGVNNGRTGSRVNPPIPLPSPDTLAVDGIDQPVTPIYPAAAFSHRDGVTIGSGYVYRGASMPQLVGKYLFTDVVTGRLFYADLAEMRRTPIAPRQMAAIHELQIVYKGPRDNLTPVARNWRMFDVIADAYAHTVGEPIAGRVLPGSSGLTNAGGIDPYGVTYQGGRADVRLSMGGDGEIYVVSKPDGMIRKLAAIVAPPPAVGAAER